MAGMTDAAPAPAPIEGDKPEHREARELARKHDALGIAHLVRSDGDTSWKSACIALEALPPCAEATRHVVEAYARGDMEPWLTAAVLKALRHDSGYETAKQILLAGPGLCSENYAVGSQ